MLGSFLNTASPLYIEPTLTKSDNEDLNKIEGKISKTSKTSTLPLDEEEESILNALREDLNWGDLQKEENEAQVKRKKGMINNIFNRGRANKEETSESGEKQHSEEGLTGKSLSSAISASSHDKLNCASVDGRNYPNTNSYVCEKDKAKSVSVLSCNMRYNQGGSCTHESYGALCEDDVSSLGTADVSEELQNVQNKNSTLATEKNKSSRSTFGFKASNKKEIKANNNENHTGLVSVGDKFAENASVSTESSSTVMEGRSKSATPKYYKSTVKTKHTQKECNVDFNETGSDRSKISVSAEPSHASENSQGVGFHKMASPEFYKRTLKEKARNTRPIEDDILEKDLNDIVSTEKDESETASGSVTTSSASLTLVNMKEFASPNFYKSSLKPKERKSYTQIEETLTKNELNSFDNGTDTGESTANELVAVPEIASPKFYKSAFRTKAGETESVKVVKKGDGESRSLESVETFLEHENSQVPNFHRIACPKFYNSALKEKVKNNRTPEDNRSGDSSTVSNEKVKETGTESGSTISTGISLTAGSSRRFASPNLYTSSSKTKERRQYAKNYDTQDTDNSISVEKDAISVEENRNILVGVPRMASPKFYKSTLKAEPMRVESAVRDERGCLIAAETVEESDDNQVLNFHRMASPKFYNSTLKEKAKDSLTVLEDDASEENLPSLASNEKKEIFVESEATVSIETSLTAVSTNKLATPKFYKSSVKARERKQTLQDDFQPRDDLSNNNSVEVEQRNLSQAEIKATVPTGVSLTIGSSNKFATPNFYKSDIKKEMKQASQYNVDENEEDTNRINTIEMGNLDQEETTPNVSTGASLTIGIVNKFPSPSYYSSSVKKESKQNDDNAVTVTQSIDDIEELVSHVFPGANLTTATMNRFATPKYYKNSVLKKYESSVNSDETESIEVDSSMRKVAVTANYTLALGAMHNNTLLDSPYETKDHHLTMNESNDLNLDGEDVDQDSSSYRGKFVFGRFMNKSNSDVVESSHFLDDDEYSMSTIDQQSTNFKAIEETCERFPYVVIFPDFSKVPRKKYKSILRESSYDICNNSDDVNSSRWDYDASYYGGTTYKAPCYNLNSFDASCYGRNSYDASSYSQDSDSSRNSCFPDSIDDPRYRRLSLNDMSLLSFSSFSEISDIDKTLIDALDSKQIPKRGLDRECVSLPNIYSLVKSVSFRTVEIREYKITIGDNPSCRTGIPVGLSWVYNQIKPLELTKYEAAKKRRKGMKKLLLSERKREALLQHYSVEDLCRARKEILKIQKSRKKSNMFGSMFNMKENVESAGKFVKNRVTLSKPH